LGAAGVGAVVVYTKGVRAVVGTTGVRAVVVTMGHGRVGAMGLSAPWRALTLRNSMRTP